MKRFISLFASAALLAGSHAQESAPPAPQVPQELIQRLFNPGATEQELMEAAKDANKAGMPRQQIIEAKLIWGLRTQNTAWLVK